MLVELPAERRDPGRRLLKQTPVTDLFDIPGFQIDLNREMVLQLIQLRGSKLAWPNSRPWRIRSTSSLKSALSDDIGDLLQAGVVPADEPHLTGGLDDHITLQG